METEKQRVSISFTFSFQGFGSHCLLYFVLSTWSLPCYGSKQKLSSFNRLTAMGPQKKKKKKKIYIYILKFQNLDYRSWSFILFVSTVSLSIFSIKCHVNLSHAFNFSNKMMPHHFYSKIKIKKIKKICYNKNNMTLFYRMN